MNWKLWLKGLAAVAIGGFSTGALQVVTGTGSVNKGTLIVGGGGALVAVLHYLAESPLGQAPATPEMTPAPPAK